MQYLLNWATDQTKKSDEMTKKIDRVEAVVAKVDTLRTDVDALAKDTMREFHVVHSRMDNFDRFRLAQGKLNATVNDRLKTLEKSSRSISKLRVEDRLSEEIAKIRSWVDEAHTMENVVVIGPTQGKPPLLKPDVDKILNDFGRNITVRVDQRGNTGVFAVHFSESSSSSPPKLLAKSFKAFITNDPARKNLVWARFDEPQVLRAATGRARRFAFDLKAKIDGGPFFQLVEGFLVFGSVLVAPVTMIPDEPYWPKLGELISQALVTAHTPFTFTATPQSQLNRSICAFLLRVMTKPGFVGGEGDDDASDEEKESMLVDTNL